MKCWDFDDAAEDVQRAVEALGAEGLARPVGPDLQLEYPSQPLGRVVHSSPAASIS